MNCSNCGAPLPEGASFCVNCGAQNNAEPDYDATVRIQDGAYNSPYSGGFQLAGQQNSQQPYQPPNQQPYQDPFQRPLPDTYQQPYQGNVQVRPSTSASTKIIIIIALLAVAGVVVFFMFKGGTGTSSSKNGEYKCIEIIYAGQSFGEELIDASGEKAILTVKGDKCDFNGENAKIKFDGSKVEVTDANATYYGTYDKDKKTITLDIEGYTFVFKKQ